MGDKWALCGGTNILHRRAPVATSGSTSLQPIGDGLMKDRDISPNYYEGPRIQMSIYRIERILAQILFSYGTAVVTELNENPDKIAHIALR
jgi:hypothetical protein